MKYSLRIAVGVMSAFAVMLGLWANRLHFRMQLIAELRQSGAEVQFDVGPPLHRELLALFVGSDGALRVRALRYNYPAPSESDFEELRMLSESPVVVTRYN